MKLRTSALAAILCVSASTGASAATPPTAAAFFDSEIVGILWAADDAAADAAAIEVERGGASEARAFASSVIADRLDQTNRAGRVRISPIDGETSDRLRREKTEAHARFSALKGRALDAAYIASATAALSAEISELDKRLLAGAEAPALVALLKDRRAVLQKHLEKARGVKAALSQ